MRLLLGITGTENSRRALEETIERVRETGDDLTIAILDLEDEPVPDSDFESDVTDMLEDADIQAEITHLSGHLGSELVSMSEEGDFDRLVISAGGRSPLGKLQVGRVPEYVILNSETTVTLIR